MDLIVKMSIMGMALSDPTLETVMDGDSLLCLQTAGFTGTLLCRHPLGQAFGTLFVQVCLQPVSEACCNPHVKHALTLPIMHNISFEDSLMIPQALPRG